MSRTGKHPRQFAGRTWELGPASIRTLERRDMPALRSWRNAQQSVLRQQASIDDEHQANWFENVVLPSYAAERPSQLLVVVTREDDPTSYGGLTNIEWTSQRAEISFLAATPISEDPDRYAMEFSPFLAWVQRFAFDELGLHRLFTETWAFRQRHIELLEASGLQLEGRLRQHVVKSGERHDALLHGLLSDEWAARRG